MLPLLLASGAFGQSVAPQAPTPVDEQTLELSPFEVNTARDVGFVATSSLAGGRLAGDLRDTPAAYSVLTSEFITALNLTDLTSASEWTVSSANLQGAGENEIWGAGFEMSSRGVSIGAQQRNFFPLNVNFDTYNLDRIDYSRGPNAILFGNGTFGGNANVVTKRAQLGRTSGSATVSYGSWDYRRVVIDTNAALGERAAVRANLLWQDRNGWRDHEFEEKKAATVAATFRLTRHTDLLIEGEKGEFMRGNPLTNLNDNITGWDGATTFANLVSGGSIPGATSTLWNQQGVQRHGSDTSPQYVFAPDLGYGEFRDFSNTMRTLAGGQNNGTPVGGVPRPNNIGLSLNNRSMLHAINAPSWRFDRVVAGSNFRVPSDRFAMSTDAPTFIQNYDTITLFLRHRIGNLYLEAAANVAEEARDTNYLDTRGINNTYIDINQHTPTGEPNPYFLEPYGDGQRSRSTWGNDYESLRLAAAYALPNTAIGSFNFGVMVGANDERQHQRIESMRVLSSPDPRLWPFQNLVYHRYYWNSPNRDLPEITSAVGRNGVNYPVGWIVDSSRPTDISYSDKAFTYFQGSAKGTFFNDKLHVLGAVRHDDLSVERVINDNYGDYPADWGGRTVQYRPAAPADYLTLPEFRPRNSNRVPTVTDGRYQDDYNPPDVDMRETTYSTGLVYHTTPWLSLFANTSTSFNPSTSQLRLDGSIMPSPVAEGWDVGLRFYLLNERVNVSLTHYQGSETAQPFEIGFTNNLQAIGFLNKLDDLPVENNNSAGFPVVPRQAFDQRDRENEGFELEVVANLTPHWRLKADVARADARQTNAWSDTRAFIEKYDSNIRQVLLDGGIIFDAEGRATLDQTIDIARRSGGNNSEANAAVSAFNNVYFNQLPNIVAGEQYVPGLIEWTGNIFTDYEFTEGPLKRLRLGIGVNYRGKQVLGFRGADTMLDPARPGDITATVDDPSVDAYTPVYSDDYYRGIATVGYSFRFRQRHNVRLQLTINNLFDDREVVYHASQVQLRVPNGDYTTTTARVATPTLFRYTTPREFRLSATVNF